MRFGIILVALALMLMLAPATAKACFASGPDGYSTGLIWDNEPSVVPEGAYVVRIEGVKPIPNTWAFSAKVLEGPSGMLGKRYQFTARNMNSCVGLGSRSGYAVVAAEKATIQIQNDKRQVLQLIDYAPTTYNDVLRAVFGGSQWRYPGEPAEEQSYPF